MVYFLFAIFIIAVCAFEFVGMARKQQKKEMIVFIMIAILAVGLGLFYISDPYSASLTRRIFDLIGKHY